MAIAKRRPTNGLGDSLYDRPMRLVKFDRHLSLFGGFEWLEWRRYEENEMSFTWNKRGYKEVVLTCNVYLQKWLVKRITTM